VTLSKLQIAKSTGIKISYLDYEVGHAGTTSDLVGWSIGTEKLMFSKGRNGVSTFSIFDHELGHARAGHLGIEPLNRTLDTSKALSEIHAEIGSTTKTVEEVLNGENVCPDGNYGC
jgi:hypothetical protein